MREVGLPGEKGTEAVGLADRLLDGPTRGSVITSDPPSGTGHGEWLFIRKKAPSAQVLEMADCASLDRCTVREGSVLG